MNRRQIVSSGFATACLVCLGLMMVPDEKAWAVAEPACGDVYFATGSSALTVAAKETLRCHAASLNGHPERRLYLEGHTDERGTPAYSLVFGERRAKSAKRYLVDELGAAANRIVTLSYGRERPVCLDHTPACRQYNRRVHIVIQDGAP